MNYWYDIYIGYKCRMWHPWRKLIYCSIVGVLGTYADAIAIIGYLASIDEQQFDYKEK